MKRLLTSTAGILDWRARLARPERQWKRTFSAMEAAVSWELAHKTRSGLPPLILRALAASGFSQPEVLLAVAEHKVRLLGGNADSQNDIWAILDSSAGQLSLAVEAKAREPFGNKKLSKWLSGVSEKSRNNRLERWGYVARNLPLIDPGLALNVPYQLLHRCACAVIEAKRFKLSHAVFLVQAFDAPDKRYDDFLLLAKSLDLNPVRNHFATLPGSPSVSIGWIDCPLCTDYQLKSLGITPSDLD